MDRMLLILCPLLVAIDIITAYSHGFRSTSAYLGQNGRHITRDSESKRISSAEHSVKSTALFSLGDPDTGGESNFYRWWAKSKQKERDTRRSVEYCCLCEHLGAFTCNHGIFSTEIVSMKDVTFLAVSDSCIIILSGTIMMSLLSCTISISMEPSSEIIPSFLAVHYYQYLLL